jgi:hypothetical protein
MVTCEELRTIQFTEAKRNEELKTAEYRGRLQRINGKCFTDLCWPICLFSLLSLLNTHHICMFHEGFIELLCLEFETVSAKFKALTWCNISGKEGVC